MNLRSGLRRRSQTAAASRLRREQSLPPAARRLASFLLVGMILMCGTTCTAGDNGAGSPPPPAGGENEGAGSSPTQADGENDWAELRRRMVEEQLAGRDITERRVLQAMRRVPRHLFVPVEYHDLAYADTPLPIGQGQTISQPYIVALMTQLAKPSPTARALDVGTGSGYQAAVLGELCRNVYSIEIVESLAAGSKKLLKELGYKNIEVRQGDGYRGWKEHAPFDVIIVAAAPDHVPDPLIEQLAVGGRLVIPVGRSFQTLEVIEKQPDGSLQRNTITFVRFVPMTGEAEKDQNPSDSAR